MRTVCPARHRLSGTFAARSVMLVIEADGVGDDKERGKRSFPSRIL